MATIVPPEARLVSSVLKSDLSVVIDPKRTWCNETYFTARLTPSPAAVLQPGLGAEVSVQYRATYTDGSRKNFAQQTGEVSLPVRGGSKEVVVRWTQPKDADPDVDFTVCIELDPERRVTESNEGNNKVCFSGTTVG